jgi:hypothetical protein
MKYEIIIYHLSFIIYHLLFIIYYLLFIMKPKSFPIQKEINNIHIYRKTAE